jgi:hypothetical protein
MDRNKTYETAAARRRNDPITLTIDGQQIHLVSSLELLDMADLIEALQAPVDEKESSLRAAAKKRNLLLQIISRFVQPGSQADFDRIAPDLDIHICSDMVQDLIEEYSGAKNPTRRQSSSRGIDAIGLPADQAINLYLYALTEHADQETRERINRALESPVQFRMNGAPAWYGDDDDAWATFQKAMRT